MTNEIHGTLETKTYDPIADPASPAVKPGRGSTEHSLAWQALWMPVAVFALLVALVALDKLPVEALLGVLPFVLGGSWISSAYTKGRSVVKAEGIRGAAEVARVVAEKDPVKPRASVNQ